MKILHGDYDTKPTHTVMFYYKGGSAHSSNDELRECEQVIVAKIPYVSAIKYPALYATFQKQGMRLIPSGSLWAICPAVDNGGGFVKGTLQKIKPMPEVEQRFSTKTEYEYGFGTGTALSPCGCSITRMLNNDHTVVSRSYCYEHTEDK